ncbi:50S ribosomal protein L2, partial [Treponema pallidum subsp. pallidum]
MALKMYRPMTAGLRGRVDLCRAELTARTPEKSLTRGKPAKAGR